MSRRAQFLYAIGATFLIAAAAFGVAYASSFRDKSTIRACATESQGQQEIECIYRAIERRLETDGLVPAMRLFKAAYETSAVFNESGCHRHAHQVGDMYYNQTRAKGETIFPANGFPVETTACGYGFFHGLFEHLTQDDPTSAVITATCGHFRNVMSSLRERRVLQICYHGSGHGLMLAHAEIASKAEWGDAFAFTSEPLQECAALPVEEVYTLQCEEGVFTMLVSWMDTQQYGFAFPKEPFKYCDAWSAPAREACYNEMAQKAGMIAPRGVIAYAEAVSRIGDEHLRSVAFETGIAGFVQGNIANGTYIKVFSACLRLDAKRQEECVRSLVRGLVEHGTPREEYRSALAFCDEQVPIGHLREMCYERAAFFLPHYHEYSEIPALCEEFPNDVRHYCDVLLQDDSNQI